MRLADGLRYRVLYSNLENDLETKGEEMSLEGPFNPRLYQGHDGSIQMELDRLVEVTSHPSKDRSSSLRTNQIPFVPIHKPDSKRPGAKRPCEDSHQTFTSRVLMEIDSALPFPNPVPSQAVKPLKRYLNL